MQPLIKIAMLLGLAFCTQSSFASIHLELTNPSPSSLLAIDSPANLVCDSLVKAGTGPYAINVNLANSGDTIIEAGTLAFFGGTINLQDILKENLGNSPNVAGQMTPQGGAYNSLDLPQSSTLFVGNGTILNARSIQVDRLVIGGTAADCLPDIQVPEPSTLLIWALLGSLALLVGWGRRSLKL